MSIKGYYPGSFDPITKGHLDIITRSASLVDHLIIGVGAHHGKSGLLDPAVRVELIKSEIADLALSGKDTIDVETFDTLTVDAARKAGASVLIRGLRDGRDFEYEQQMAGMNAKMAPGIETIFLAASPETSIIASSLVKQIAVMKGDISEFVTPRVADAIAQQLAGK